MLKTIKRDKLLENTLEAGEVLMSGLTDLQTRYPQYLKNARGRGLNNDFLFRIVKWYSGTFCAIDCDTGARRDQVIAQLRVRGVHCGGCGEAAIRLRPALVFQVCPV